MKLSRRCDVTLWLLCLLVASIPHVAASLHPGVRDLIRYADAVVVGHLRKEPNATGHRMFSTFPGIHGFEVVMSTGVAYRVDRYTLTIESAGKGLAADQKVPLELLRAEGQLGFGFGPRVYVGDTPFRGRRALLFLDLCEDGIYRPHTSPNEVHSLFFASDAPILWHLAQDAGMVVRGRLDSGTTGIEQRVETCVALMDVVESGMSDEAISRFWRFCAAVLATNDAGEVYGEDVQRFIKQMRPPHRMRVLPYHGSDGAPSAEPQR